ncbi:HNH endonuclease [Streptomyces sp. NPDC005373]|uniref:HNH endonuclease signature motif containing protein n=1 Tax=Streptomyces sp. NPDC005373 TaxID=3156879 RepID=UPI0033A5BB11
MIEAGIDISHFPQRWERHTEELLREVVAVSYSIKDVVRRLGIRQRSPARRNAEDILVRLPSGAPRSRTMLLRRALDDIDRARLCAECGLGETWQGKRLVLEIDHIIGDRLDNRPENLRYLCPNCHATTSSWCRGGESA